MGKAVVNSGVMDYAVHRRETALLVVYVIVLGAGIGTCVSGGRSAVCVGGYAGRASWP
jgi:hypothetical protein